MCVYDNNLSDISTAALNLFYVMVMFMHLMKVWLLLQICSELNQGTLRRVREWGGARGEWRWQVSDEPAGRMAQVSYT